MGSMTENEVSSTARRGAAGEGGASTGPVSGRALREALADDAWLDEVIGRTGDEGVRLTGEGGFLPELVKAVLERGLATELSDHLGYDRGDPAGRGSPNSRNGFTPKTVATEVGPVGLDTPRDRAGSFEPRLVPKGQRRLGGLDEIIISLYAGGMTVRDIGHHLERTLGTELSHDTIWKDHRRGHRGGQGLAGPPARRGLPHRLPRCAGGEGPRRSPGAEQGRAPRGRGGHRWGQARAGDLGAIG